MNLRLTMFDSDSVNIDIIIPMTGTKIHVRFLFFIFVTTIFFKSSQTSHSSKRSNYLHALMWCEIEYTYFTTCQFNFTKKKISLSKIKYIYICTRKNKHYFVVVTNEFISCLVQYADLIFQVGQVLLHCGLYNIKNNAQ